jgi:hypothetical protein
MFAALFWAVAAWGVVAAGSELFDDDGDDD